MEIFIASHLKDMNRQKVYKLLYQMEQTSKSEIARLTGISAPTVIKIINFLKDKDLIIENGEGVSTLGRKPQMITLNKNKYYAISVILEGSFLKVGLVNLTNQIIDFKKVEAKSDINTLFDKFLYAIIDEMLKKHKVKHENLLGIGLGIPGVYNTSNNEIVAAPLIGITKRKNINNILNNIKQRYNVEILVENDLNMEVMGEFISLNLTNNDDLIYLSLGTGVGTGVILNGELRRGKNNMCGEVGYMRFFDDQNSGLKNAGWLEEKLSVTTLEKTFLNAEDNKTDVMKNKKAMIDYASILSSLCLNNIMMCYDVNNISIGGEMFDLLGIELFDEIKRRFEEMVDSDTDVVLRLKSTSEPGIIGAAGNIIQHSISKILEE